MLIQKNSSPPPAPSYPPDTTPLYSFDNSTTMRNGLRSDGTDFSDTGRTRKKMRMATFLGQCESHYQINFAHAPDAPCRMSMSRIWRVLAYITLSGNHVRLALSLPPLIFVEVYPRQKRVFFVSRVFPVLLLFCFDSNGEQLYFSLIFIPQPSSPHPSSTPVPRHPATQPQHNASTPVPTTP